MSHAHDDRFWYCLCHLFPSWLPFLVMQVTFERPATDPARSWRYVIRRERAFDYAWHYHAEDELTLITEGDGTLFVGDCIRPYHAGDLTLIGGNLPHTYVSAPEQSRHEAVVVHFRRDFLGLDLLERPEFGPVTALLGRSSRGLVVSDKRRIPELLGWNALGGAERTVALLGLLVELARETGPPLVSLSYRPLLRPRAHSRIDTVCQYLHREYVRSIGLEEIAQIAHLTPAAFSRFFHRATGLSLTDYLTELRIGAACRLLTDTELPITTVAARAGYQNLSNFNRRFRGVKNMTPREYRNRFAHRE